MPLYQYECAACGLVELVRPMAERDARTACPTCDGRLVRGIWSAPRLGATNRGRVDAHARNERARDSPTRASERDEPARHPAGCGCCKPGAAAGNARTTTRTAADGAKSFPTKRPWMIAH